MVNINFISYIYLFQRQFKKVIDEKLIKTKMEINVRGCTRCISVMAGMGDSRALILFLWNDNNNRDEYNYDNMSKYKRVNNDKLYC